MALAHPSPVLGHPIAALMTVGEQALVLSSGCPDLAASPAGLSLCPPFSSIPTNPRLGSATPSPHSVQRASLAAPSCPTLCCCLFALAKRKHSCPWGIGNNCHLQHLLCKVEFSPEWSNCFSSCFTPVRILGLQGTLNPSSSTSSFSKGRQEI